MHEQHTTIAALTETSFPDSAHHQASAQKRDKRLPPHLYNATIRRFDARNFTTLAVFAAIASKSPGDGEWFHAPSHAEIGAIIGMRDDPAISGHVNTLIRKFDCIERRTRKVRSNGMWRTHVEMMIVRTDAERDWTPVTEFWLRRHAAQLGPGGIGFNLRMRSVGNGRRTFRQSAASLCGTFAMSRSQFDRMARRNAVARLLAKNGFGDQSGWTMPEVAEKPSSRTTPSQPELSSKTTSATAELSSKTPHVLLYKSKNLYKSNCNPKTPTTSAASLERRGEKTRPAAAAAAPPWADRSLVAFEFPSPPAEQHPAAECDDGQFVPERKPLTVETAHDPNCIDGQIVITDATGNITCRRCQECLASDWEKLERNRASAAESERQRIAAIRSTFSFVDLFSVASRPVSLALPSAQTIDGTWRESSAAPAEPLTDRAAAAPPSHRLDSVLATSDNPGLLFVDLPPSSPERAQWLRELVTAYFECINDAEFFWEKEDNAALDEFNAVTARWPAKHLLDILTVATDADTEITRPRMLFEMAKPPTRDAASRERELRAARHGSCVVVPEQRFKLLIDYASDMFGGPGWTAEMVALWTGKNGQPFVPHRWSRGDYALARQLGVKTLRWTDSELRELLEQVCVIGAGGKSPRNFFAACIHHVRDGLDYAGWEGPALAKVRPPRRAATGIAAEPR